VQGNNKIEHSCNELLVGAICGVEVNNFLVLFYLFFQKKLSFIIPLPFFGFEVLSCCHVIIVHIMELKVVNYTTIATTLK
jgi:hypothetical protein